MSTLTTGDGIDIDYTDWPGDRSDSRAVVLSHAWGLDSGMWSYQLPALTDAGLRAITYDRRGHGRSGRPGTAYDLDTFADDLADLINGLDLHDIVLVGQSLGSCEVVRYLTRHGGDRVSRLVLSAPTSPYLLRTDDNPAGIIEPDAVTANRDLLRIDVGKWMAAYPGYPHSYFGNGHQVSPEMQDWTMRRIFDTPLPILLATFGPFDLRADLAKITVPTLVLHGDADFSAPLEASGRRIAEYVPDAELVVFEGAGHGLYSYVPEKYNAELVRFAQAG